MSGYRPSAVATTRMPQNLQVVPSHMTTRGASPSYTGGGMSFQYAPGLNALVSYSNPSPYGSRNIPLAPINRLPSEVLELIFLDSFWVPGYPVWDRTPLFISQVCTRWRSIAFGHSALWSCIILPDTKFRPSLHAFPVWLERARDHGLKVILRSKQAHLVPTLSSIIHRCEYLILDMSEETACAATAIPFVNASRLKSIEILPYKCNIDTVDKICANAYSARNLKTLKITLKTLSTTSPLLTRSWPHLTSLTVTAAIPGYQLASIAQNFPQLTYLKIGLRALSQPNTGCIQFPLLETLFMIVPWDPISEYFDVLSVPSLKSLYASCGYLQADRNLPRSLENLLSSSKYPLETLSLNFRAERDLGAFLQLPSLRRLHELHLDSLNKITDETAKLLLSTVPHLQSLSMSSCATSDGIVSSILASRFQYGKSAPPRSLKFASIEFWRSPLPGTSYTGCHDRDEQAFDQLINKGLDIRGQWIVHRKLRQEKRGMNMY